MSTPHEVTAQRNRRLITVLIALVAVLALALAISVGYALGSGGTGGAASRPSEPSASPASPSPSPPPTGSAGPIRLSGGNSQIDGRYPVKFPHTPEGAVSFSAASVVAQTTLDPAIKARSGQLYYNEMRNSDLAELTEAMRFKIGLDLETLGFGMMLEELPPQASVSTLPLAAYYEAVDARTVDVVLLVEVSTYDGISRRNSILVTTEAARCVWMEDVRDGDWMVAADLPKIETPDKAQPHTAAFENSDWIPLQGGAP